jgi:hypothetical protein
VPSSLADQPQLMSLILLLLQCDIESRHDLFARMAVLLLPIAPRCREPHRMPPRNWVHTTTNPF